MTDRELMQQALEALVADDSKLWPRHNRTEAIAALRERLAQPEQEPVAWPCLIAEADFSEDTVLLKMQCTDYKVSAGKHWLYTTPPQRKPDHIVDVTKMVPFQDLAAELFVVAQISPADDGFSDTMNRIEAWLRNHFSTLTQRKPLTDEEIDAEWRELDGEASALFKHVIRKFARAIEAKLREKNK